MRLKKRAIHKSMNKAHRFLEYFFSCDNWHRFYLGQEFAASWYKNINVDVAIRGPQRSKVRIRVTQDWLYQQFKEWMSRNMPNSGRFDQPTFLDRIKEMGVVIPDRKQRLWGRCCRVVDIFFCTFLKSYCIKYKCDEVTEWPTETPEGLQRIRGDILRVMKRD